MTDPIADFLTRVRNAISSGQTKVVIPGSRVKAGICKVLKDEGYIKSFKILVKESNKIFISVQLKENAVAGIARVSKPGLRIYKSYREIPRISSGLGISILSTSSGIVSSREAKFKKIGGEILCNIW
ncbi:MAG: 30S ribosomal protein S8 [Oligoflexia bacterium]|nr:30S ribosomal protein S8 [Oligoflexia bacterium]